MRVYDPNLPLISLHVPKCAGTSFADVLKRWFGKKGLHPHYFDEKKRQKPIAANLSSRGLLRRRRHCVHGHFNPNRGFGVRDYYPDAEQFITILRDPFELHLSNFFYMKRRGPLCHRDGKPRQEATDTSYGLETYLAEESSSFMLLSWPFDLSLDNYQEIIEEHFVHVGLAEDLQGSVDKLAERLGFPAIKVPTLNVSPRTEGIPDGARERFRANNEVEFAVYDYVRSRVNKVPEGSGSVGASHS